MGRRLTQDFNRHLATWINSRSSQVTLSPCQGNTFSSKACSPMEGAISHRKKKEVGHKNKTNTCTDQMMFCICTVQIMHCLPGFEHHANDHLSQKVSVILAAPAPRAQLQPSCSPCAVQLRKEHL